MTKMILSLTKDEMEVLREQDVVPFRNRVREYAGRIKMGLVNQTKLITAASELVRNMLNYAKGGRIRIEIVSRGRDYGIRLTFADNGPGIANIDLAMKDGWTTARSMGLGLPGAKRLVNEFNIQSEVGKGTTVTIIKWTNG